MHKFLYDGLMTQHFSILVIQPVIYLHIVKSPKIKNSMWWVPIN